MDLKIKILMKRALHVKYVRLCFHDATETAVWVNIAYRTHFSTPRYKYYQNTIHCFFFSHEKSCRIYGDSNQWIRGNYLKWLTLRALK